MDCSDDILPVLAGLALLVIATQAVLISPPWLGLRRRFVGLSGRLIGRAVRP